MKLKGRRREETGKSERREVFAALKEFVQGHSLTLSSLCLSL